jgi:hypothetical protein
MPAALPVGDASAPADRYAPTPWGKKESVDEGSEINDEVL